MNILRSRVFCIAVTLAMVPFALVNLNFPESFTGYALASAFLIHVITRTNPREWFLAFLLGLLLNLGASHVASWLRLSTAVPPFSLAMVGAGSFIVLGWRSASSVSKDDPQSASPFLQSTVLLVLVLASRFMLQATRPKGPFVFDSFLLAFDQTLGCRPALPEALIRRMPLLNHAIEIAYNGTPLVAAMVCAAYTRYVERAHLQLLKVIVVAGVLGFLVYLLFPAVGPRYLPELTTGSLSPFSLERSHNLLQIPLDVARNAMPSLHMAWALLIWLEARALPRPFRTVALAYMLLTPIIVLALGEHYLVDIVVAIPFSLLVESLCVDSQPIASSVRRRAAVTGTLITAGWLLLLRFGTPIFISSSIASWIFVIGSTGISAVMIHQLLGPTWKQHPSFGLRIASHSQPSHSEHHRINPLTE